LQIFMFQNEPKEWMTRDVRMIIAFLCAYPDIPDDQYTMPPTKKLRRIFSLPILSVWQVTCGVQCNYTTTDRQPKVHVGVIKKVGTNS
jgi:hypothetical protein